MIQNFKKILNFYYKTNKIHIEYDKNKYYDITKKVRNMTVLDDKELLFIKTLPNEQINELFTIYNSCFILINEIYKP